MKNLTLSLAALMLASPLLAETFNSVTINGSLNVGGTANLNGHVNLGNQNSDVSTASGDFRVNANTRLGDGGADTTTIWGTLNLSSLTSISGSPNFTGSISVVGNITAQGGNHTLPNQTLGTADHIVTRELGDVRYALASSVSGFLTSSSAESTYRRLDDSYTQGEIDTAVGARLLTTVAETTYRRKDDSYDQAQVDAKFTPYLLSATAASTYRTQDDSYSKADLYTKTEAQANFWSDNEAQIVIGNHEVADPTAAIIVGNGVDAQNLNNAFVVKQSGVVKIGDIEIDPVAGVVTVPERGDIDMGGYQ